MAAEKRSIMRVPQEKRKSLFIYVIVGLLICGIFLQHRKDDCMQTFSTWCKSYDNVTDIRPALSLPAGEYTIDLKIDAQETVSEAVLQVYSNTEGTFLTAPINNMEEFFTGSFRLDRPCGEVNVRVVYAGYDGSEEARVETTSMKIGSDRPLCGDAMLWMCLFLALYLLGGFYYFSGRKAAREELYALLIGLAVVFSSYPLMKEYLFFGHDLNFHLSRIEGIKEGLLCGQFPVRIHPSHNEGYGYATAALYPELFLYIPAILRVMGVSATASLSFFLFLVNLTTALVMYYAVKSIAKSSGYAVLASVIYTLSIYRFGCIYTRMALGEVLALCFMPLVVSGIYHVFIGDQRKWIQLVVGATAIFQSHMIGTLLTAVLAVYLGLIYFKNLFVDRRWLSLLKSIALIVLLNLWFLVPFLDFYGLDLKLNDVANVFHDQAVIPAQLFSLFGADLGFTGPLEEGVYQEMSLTLGITVSLCLLYAAVRMFGRGVKKNSFGRPLFWFGLLCVAGSTTLIPWKSLEELGAVNALTAVVQFPWRFLGPATVMIVMSAAIIGAESDFGRMGEREKRLALVTAAFLAVMGCIPPGTEALQEQDVHLRRLQAVKIDNGRDQEYLLNGTVRDLLQPGRYLTSSDQVRITEYEKNGTDISVAYKSDETAWIEVPLLWYPGYKAVDMSTGTELPVQNGDNHVIRVTVPPAEAEGQGNFRVFYAGRARYHGADGISLLTLLGCGVTWGWRRRKRLF